MIDLGGTYRIEFTLDADIGVCREVCEDAVQEFGWMNLAREWIRQIER